MSFIGHTIPLITLLIVVLSVQSSQQHTYRGTVIANFTGMPEQDNLPKSHVCSLSLAARRERCSAAAKCADCSQYGCKILFGTPGKPFTYEFEYVNPKDGKKTERKWGVRCPSRPVMFITAGPTDDDYEVMILKQVDETNQLSNPAVGK